MRAAAREVEEAGEALKAVEQQREAARHRIANAHQRKQILDETLRKHVYEDIPILQAKMIAHEEQGELNLQDANQRIANGSIIAGKIVASQIASNSITAAKIFAAQATNATLASIAQTFNGKLV